MLEYETIARTKGYDNIVGVDEAGRGPLAGPVVAAAVSLVPSFQFEGLDDSKKLSPEVREKFFPIIKEQALGYGIGIVDVKTIGKFTHNKLNKSSLHLNALDEAEILIICKN